MTEIIGARVLVTGPGRNGVTLKITTSDGVVGCGDATLNGRELAVASYLTDHLCPLLVGRDPARIEDTWQLLYKGAYWRRGPVTMTAIAAVDMALWDIKGKVAGCRSTSCSAGRAGRRAGLLPRQRRGPRWPSGRCSTRSGTASSRSPSG
ncbi:MAG: mannonate dehydratase [Pseudonocardia sp.]